MRKNAISGRVCLFLTVLTAFFCTAGCGTVNFTAPLEGRYVTASVAVKDFEVVGTVFAGSTETHSAGPLGFVKRVEGSKVTYADLLREAALIHADDIIDVRIDMNAGKAAGFAEWLTGWERIFTYTGEAVAIRYVDKGRAVKDRAVEEVEEFYKTEGFFEEFEEVDEFFEETDEFDFFRR